MAVSSFRDLVVWQKSINLVQEIYAVTKQLPGTESFGLSGQLQRASVSIPSNIAEGSKRRGRADFRKFCMVAMGSAAELETQLIIVSKLYPTVSVDQALSLLTEVQKMLSALIRQLKVSVVKS